MDSDVRPGSRHEFDRHPSQLLNDRVVHALDSNIETGLNSDQIRLKRDVYGSNKLSGQGGVKWYSVLLKQITNAMILVLLLAMALAFGVSDYVEGGIITLVIILNILIGFLQEFRAEQQMDSLRALSSPSATVLREGVVETIPSTELVPGDVVLIRTGDTTPADLRLFESMNLECDEKILTGEAIPIAKDPAVDFSNSDNVQTSIGDRTNMAHASSTVTKGRGQGIVVFTGMSTEIGKIAESMQGTQRKPNRSLSSKKHGTMQPVKGLTLRTWDGVGKFLGLTTGTPLQIKLSKLAYFLFAFAILLAIVVFGVNRFNVTREVAIYAISTGIAMIPESLIAVLTITFVTGMTQMRKRKVLTRKLSALEALGGITNICSDKTGTLTQGIMTARKAWIPALGIYTVNSSKNASDPTKGSVTLDSAEMSTAADAEKTGHTTSSNILPGSRDPESDGSQEEDEKYGRSKESVSSDVSDTQVPTNGPLAPQLEDFLLSSALCNLATLRHDEQQGKWHANGDPTEVALQVFSHRFDRGRRKLEEGDGWKQLHEYPFDSGIKRMSVIFEAPTTGQLMMFTKGAVERVLELCVDLDIAGNKQPITSTMRHQIIDQMSAFADEGLRVLALAQKVCSSNGFNAAEASREESEKDLTFLGLIGLYDPPRLETKDAIKECNRAGIQVHMLTGDHPGTATAIAREIGIIPSNCDALPKDISNSLVKNASDFDDMTDDQIDQMPELPLVIARCAPNTKSRMIAALHRRRRYAAMTGDGVNDGPSLQAADVGIAMGLAGSDVAKNASDIVLTDDNFASIVSAIEEGRRMFDNIQKFVLHLLTSNVGEVVLLICGLGFKDQTNHSVFPLSPLQILWINMVTSGFPAFGLGREKSAFNIMQRPPHDNKKGVFTLQIIVDMIVYGFLMGILTLCTFVIVVYGVGNGDLGMDCNASYSESCDLVFRARATVFAELTWLILVSAWEIKSIRRSMFRLDPGSSSRFPFFRDIFANKFLFFAVVIGALVVFPCIYIPQFNTVVFKHVGITWEWGLAGGGLVVFVIGMETWKMIKRCFGLFETDGSDPELRLENNINLR